MKNESLVSNREFLPLYAVIFLGFLGYALTITLFIPMILDERLSLLPPTSSTSLRITVSGFLLAMYPLGQFLGSPIIGKLSDHFGRKKMLVISLLGCMIGFFSIGFSIYNHSLSLLFVFCLLTGLCESNMAISQSIIADRSPNPEQKTKLIGYVYSACSLGFMVGPLFGGSSAATWGYSVPFLITGFSVLCLLLWLCFSLQDRYQADRNQPIKLIETLTALKTVFNQVQLRRIYLINFLIFFAVQGLYRVIPLYVAYRWDPPLQTYALLISFVSFMCFLANLFIIGRLAKQFTTQKLLGWLLVLGGIIVLSVVIPIQFSWIWLTYGLAVVPTVMALTTCTTWLSNQVSHKDQGQVLGNNQALLVLGESSSAAIGGVIAAILAPLPIIVMGSILLLAGYMVYKTENVNAN